MWGKEQKLDFKWIKDKFFFLKNTIKLKKDYEDNPWHDRKS